MDRPTRSPPEFRPRHLLPLDGLRGFAALLVLWCHFPYIEGSAAARLVADLGYMSASGYFGVDLFFALSGFLITRILLAERRARGSIRLGRFFVRRSLRIFPIYFLTVGYCAVALGLDGGALATALTYTINFAPELHRDSPLVHGWSLAVEEQFYLFWPLVIGLVPLAMLPRMVSRWIPAVALLCGVTCILGGVDWAVNSVFARMLSLAAGASLAFGEPESPRWRSGPWIAVFLACAGVLMVTQPVSIHGGMPERDALLARYLLFALAAYSLLRIVIGGRGTVADRLRAGFSWSPLRWVGRYSYGLYLFHVPIILSLGLTTHDAVSPARFVQLVVLCVAIPLASYHLIEAPLLSLRERGARGPREQRSPSLRGAVRSRISG